jgi:diaminopropionate ammonia-lyase
MKILNNPYRNTPNAPEGLTDVPYPASDPAPVMRLLAQCPSAAETPLIDAKAIAGAANVGAVYVKDERGRMGLGSFKALGAAYVIACDAVARSGDDLAAALTGETYVTASAGNHGMSVAAGARVFGAKAVIYIAETVPETFAERLREQGAQVIRDGAEYEASMQAAQNAAKANGWKLLSDSSWPGYFSVPHKLMEGYLAMAEEAAGQLGSAPSHIILQAGVGGLAGAVAAHARAVWGDAPRIVVVEPEVAPALYESIRLGRPVLTSGPVSTMGRLDCKMPSLIALKGLARDADDFVTLAEAEANGAMPILSAAELHTTPSGGAGLAVLLAMGHSAATLGLSATSKVLCFLSEGPEA